MTCRTHGWRPESLPDSQTLPSFVCELPTANVQPPNGYWPAMNEVESFAVFLEGAVAAFDGQPAAVAHLLQRLPHHRPADAAFAMFSQVPPRSNRSG